MKKARYNKGLGMSICRSLFSNWYKIIDRLQLQYFYLALTSFLIIPWTFISSGNQAVAQITPDSTLPNNSTVKQEQNTSIITGGTTAGNNLFHSFKEFSLSTGATAYFNNTVDIQNIITRVTGSSISNIDGLIRANGNANLFLINPNGIIFGANASLNIGGSFFATTANSIKFADDIEFSAKTSSTTPLLTVSVPIGLQFGNNPARIQLQGNGQGIRTPTKPIDTTVGLRVEPNQTLALIGGDISAQGATLLTAGGRIELGSVGQESLVKLTRIDKGFSLGYDGVQNFGNIQLSQQAAVDASGEGGGDIQVMGRRVTLTGGSQIQTSTLGSKPGGALVVNASESVEVIGVSPFDTEISSVLVAGVYPEATGSGGNLEINTGTLLIRDGGQAGAATFGAGKGGNLTVNATNSVQLIDTRANDSTFSTGLFTSSGSDSTGAAGNLTINTDELLVQGGSKIITGTFGAGNGGNLEVNASQKVQLISTRGDGSSSSELFTGVGQNATGTGGNLTINTKELLVQDGSQVNASTFGKGNGGNLVVNASQKVQLIDTSPADSQSSNGLFTKSQSSATGRAGDLKINTAELLVQGGSEIITGTSGAGNGGNLEVNASQKVQLISTRGNGSVPSKLFTGVGQNATGTGGNLTINTRELLVQDGSQISTSTSGAGNGGNLVVNASKRVQLTDTSSADQLPNGLFASSASSATGRAGDLTINTGELLVQGGSEIRTNTDGAGNGGNLIINAFERVQLDGTRADGSYRSILFTGVDQNATGTGGNLTINTNELLVQGGAQVSAATFGAGNGGNLTVNASEKVELIGISSKDKISTGLFTSSVLDSTGGAGDITINTGKLVVRDGAAVSVQGQKKGNAGNLEVNARSIRLENFGILTASTNSINTDPNKPQATINIRSKDLILLGESIISTNARGENVIGGNININTGVLAAFQNSDITANSADFRGGRVQITASGVFGTQPRNLLTQQSDITATGATPQLSGTVELNILDTDPTQGLVELPKDIIDASRLLEQNLCLASYENEFIITGRGGLPNSPGQALQADVGWEDWRILEESKSDNRQQAVSPPAPRRNHQSKIKDNQQQEIVEAQGWIIDSHGDVVLVANPVTTTPDSFWSPPPDCQGS